MVYIHAFLERKEILTHSTHSIYMRYLIKLRNRKNDGHQRLRRGTGDVII